MDHNSQIMQYIDQHLVLQIGTTMPQFLCAEALFDNYEELISLVDKTEGIYISKIVWWERADIKLRSEYGGPRDPMDPEHYFFSETEMGDNFKPETTVEEFLSYIKMAKEKFVGHEICPAFDILTN